MRSSGGWVSCAIALGSNLGDSRAILKAAIQALDALPEVQVRACSPWYQTQPIGPPQPDYLNGCACLQTSLAPAGLLEKMLAIEAQFGRVRTVPNAPRTLDLDLLLVEEQILTLPTLQVPHPRMRDRAFVLVPLADIAPDWIEPISGQSIAALRQAVDCSGVHHIESHAIWF